MSASSRNRGATSGYSNVPSLPPIPNPLPGTIAAQLQQQSNSNSNNNNNSINNSNNTSAGGFISYTPQSPLVSSNGKVTQYNTQPTERTTGGKATSVPKNFRPPKTGTGAVSAACFQQHRSRKDPAVRPAAITGAEASRGVMSLVERGLLPPNASLDGLLGGGIKATPAPIYNAGVEQFRRREVAGFSGGGSSIFGGAVAANVKYDMIQIAKIPAKALHDPDVLKRMMPTQIDTTASTNVSLVPAPPPPLEGTAPPAEASKPIGAGTSRDDSRTYSQLLDLYSLHEFIIRKGHTLRNTPEFVSYRRSYTHCWGSIEQLLKLLEGLLQSYSVPLAYIDGKRLANLAAIDLGTPSKDELLSCIANINEVGHYMVSPAQTFQQKGLNGQTAAAVKIQSTFRMYLAQQQYRRLRIATWAARIIQAQWACHRDHLRTRKAIASLKDALALQWRETMEKFINNWDRIKVGKRTIIHLPSLSYPTYQCKRIGQPFHSLQASQLMRLADLRDPNVDIILVSPFKVEAEALQYYIGTLKAAGAPNPEGRLVVLVPENSRRLPQTLSLTKIILLSTKMLRVLSSMAKGKQCYIVPQVVGPDELYLASKLNIPMLSTEPRIAPSISTKSGQKAILEAAEAAGPIGAYHIKTIKELYVALARFIVEYRDITKWVIKINNEEASRGHAIVDVQRLRSVADPNGKGDGNGVVTVDAVVRELAESAGKRIKLVNTTSYPDWLAYAGIFDKVGGCVEAIPTRIIASPTMNLFIEPSGAIHVHSAVENIFSPPMCVLGSIFPQTSTPYEALREAAKSIAEAAFRKKVMGYLSIDFVVYEKLDPLTRERGMRMWAVDIDLGWTNNACMHRFVELVTGATFDGEGSGQSYLSTGSENQSLPLNTSGSVAASSSGSSPLRPLKYIYSGLILNPYIGVIRHGAFFATCREKGLSFDLSSRNGVLFHLVDVLLRGCIGVVCVAPSFSSAVSSLLGIQQLLQSELPREAETAANSNYAHFVSAVKQLCSLKIAVSERKRGTGK